MHKLFFLLSLFATSLFAEYKSCFSKVAILIPTERESHHLLNTIENKKELIIQNTYHLQGEIAKHQILFSYSGVGKINAAIATTDLIRQFHPDIIFMSGSAGNLNHLIQAGETVVGFQVMNADFGHLTRHGPEINKKDDFNGYFNRQISANLRMNPGLKKWISTLRFSKKLPRVYWGKIATSDFLPNPADQARLLREAGVDLVDMEGAAFMQACNLYHTPCVLIRGASDFIDPDTHDINQQAGDAASQIVIEIIKQLEQCH